MRLLHVLRSLRPRLARPKTFLGFVSLQMGTEIISATLFFNKLTGAYGLLAILTGFSLSATQLSAYLYNLAVLILLAVCIPHIRRETPLPNITLAWAYTIDTLINAAYTAVFAVSWYLASNSVAAGAVAAAATTAAVAAAATAAASATVSATATAGAAAALASSAGPHAVAASSSSAALAALASGTALAFRDGAAGTATATLGAAALAGSSVSPATTAGGGGWMSVHETTASLTLIVLVTVVRFYFCFVVIAHTRQALQRYGDRVVESSAAADGALSDDDDRGDDDDDNDDSGSGEGKSRRPAANTVEDAEAGLKPGARSSRSGRRRRRRRTRPSYPGRPSQHSAAPSGLNSNNPFAPGSPAGEGWKGRLGRVLVNLGGRNFWLGRQQDDDWTRDTNARFRPSPP